MVGAWSRVYARVQSIVAVDISDAGHREMVVCTRAGLEKDRGLGAFKREAMFDQQKIRHEVRAAPNLTAIPGLARFSFLVSEIDLDGTSIPSLF